MKRVLEQILCRHPLAYLRLLRAMGRGSMEKRLFLALVRRGDVVFDIGANRGHFTRLFSRIVGETGAVHAFEPLPETFEMLRSSFAVAGCPANLTLIPCAVGDTRGKATMHLPSSDDGQASLRLHEGGSWTGASSIQHHECEVTTLDDYAASLARLEFVKCDVEGAELPALKGGRETLKRLKPIVSLEVNSQWTRDFGYKPGDVLSELRSLGYDRFFAEGETLIPVKDGDAPDGGNILCAVSRVHDPRLANLDRI